MEKLTYLLQVILSLGLLNVWLIRFKDTTAYRGGRSLNLKEEFISYGLPNCFFYLIGILKIGIAILLLLGFWFKFLLFPSSILLSFLMIGAVYFHFKIKDPIFKIIPASLMLILSITLSVCCI